MTGADLPRMLTAVPGPKSRAAIDRLAAHECPAITARRARRASAIGAADYDPVVFDQAVGANIFDADGNCFVDLTSGFGVALVGHRHPDVVAAARAQSERLLHAMGDAYPDLTRIALLEALARVTPPGLDVGILGLSGSDAVDGAVKTARLATGRRGVLAFGGGYHGLALGVLGVQGYNTAFVEPFHDIVHPEVSHLPWACDLDQVRQVLAGGAIGLVLVEPVQGRGGMRTAPAGWLRELAQITRDAGALLALDEVQSGMGRTGSWFAATEEGVTPDLLCVGKALGGGFPLSACMGTREVMNAWGASRGEALHTQTFLGHPVGCAAGLAVLELIERDGVLAQVRELGDFLRQALQDRGFAVWGRGLMIGVGLPVDALKITRDLLARGFLTLPAGAQAIGLTPPACLTRDQARAFVDALAEVCA